MQRYDLYSIIWGINEHSNIKPTNVWEVGSRDGHDAHAIAQAFNLSDDRCYVFEAIPAACESIIRTYPSMHTFNHAVSDKEGLFDFTVEDENVGASSLYKRKEPSKGTVIQVEALRMDTIIDQLGIQTIDTMKLDVEGHTLPVLNSFGKHIDKLQSLQLEAEHIECWIGQSQFPEIKEWLEAHGFVMIMFTLLRGVQSDSFWLKKERMIL